MAIALGRPVKQLQREINSAEFTRWMAFYEINPFDGKRMDFLFGQLLFMIASAFSGDKAKDFKFEDFIPDFEANGEPKEETVDEKAERQMKIKFVFSAFADLGFGKMVDGSSSNA